MMMWKNGYRELYKIRTMYLNIRKELALLQETYLLDLQ